MKNSFKLLLTAAAASIALCSTFAMASAQQHVYVITNKHQLKFSPVKWSDKATIYNYTKQSVRVFIYNDALSPNDATVDCPNAGGDYDIQPGDSTVCLLPAMESGAAYSADIQTDPQSKKTGKAFGTYEVE